MMEHYPQLKKYKIGSDDFNKELAKIIKKQASGSKEDLDSLVEIACKN